MNENMTMEERLRIETIVTDAAKRLAKKLNQEIERGNDFVVFTFALILAGIKDALDLGLTALLIALFAFLGPFTFILEIPGIFLSVFLFAFLWGKGWFLKGRIKIIRWILALFIDNIPGVSALPMNIFMVLYAWRIVKKRAKAAEEKLEKIKELTEKEIEDLDKDISLLDVE